MMTTVLLLVVMPLTIRIDAANIAGRNDEIDGNEALNVDDDDNDDVVGGCVAIDDIDRCC